MNWRPAWSTQFQTSQNCLVRLHLTKQKFKMFGLRGQKKKGIFNQLSKQDMVKRKQQSTINCSAYLLACSTMRVNAPQQHFRAHTCQTEYYCYRFTYMVSHTYSQKMMDNKHTQESPKVKAEREHFFQNLGSWVIDAGFIMLATSSFL